MMKKIFFMDDSFWVTNENLINKLDYADAILNQ